MESLILSSAFLGISIGTSLCSFWMACQGTELKEWFLGVASAAILCAGILGSITAHTWRLASADVNERRATSPRKYLYSAIPQVKLLDSIPESDVESLPHV